MAEGLQEADRFKAEFKRYKKRDADFSDVIDFAILQQCGTQVRKPFCRVQELAVETYMYM